MTLMKKYFLLSLILITINAYSQTGGKVVMLIQTLPYANPAQADLVVTGMKTWDKSDWKSVFRLLDDDSLKVKATYALSLFINTAPREQAVALLKNNGRYAKSEYAQSFLHAESNLLTDTATIIRQNASLPLLPTYTPAPTPTSNGEQQLLQLEDNLALAQNPIEKKRILAKAAIIPGFSSFILVSKSLKVEAVNKDAALIVTRLALADETI